MLVLHRVEVRRNDQVVIRHASLQSDSPGLVFVVGAGGAGKSTLLAAMAGSQSHGALRVSGMAKLDNHDLFDRKSTVAAWLPQHAELRSDAGILAQLSADHGVGSAEVARWLDDAGIGIPAGLLDGPAAALSPSARRLLARLGVLARDASLYLLDEPTSGLDDGHVPVLRTRIAEVGRHAAVVVATHNRQDCLSLGGRTALLAGGTIQECSETTRFFVSPVTPAGHTYVQTGNCNLASSHRSLRNGDGFWALIPGLLCGMSRPGLAREAAEQYRRLAASGVRALVCMEERREYPLGELQESGLSFHHYAVPDMAPPNFAQAVDLCRLAEPLIRNNKGVAVHCRGGLGRTGTALAAILIWFGDDPQQAIARIRAAQPLAIQTMAQVRFLRDFADRIRGWQQPPMQLERTSCP